jgi:hypothetical protein
MMKCPLCSGSGEITPPKESGKNMQAKVDLAVMLTGMGYSRREVMALMGYKSPRMIQYLLKRK